MPALNPHLLDRFRSIQPIKAMEEPLATETKAIGLSQVQRR